MSTIGKNIKKIRTIKKISQQEFAELFGLSRANIGSYEEGRAEPKVDAIIKMARHFGLSVDVLLTKELTINELYKFDIFQQEYQLALEQGEVEEDKDHRKEDTPLVKKEHYLEYIVNYQHRDYINKLPFVRLPDTQYDKTRAFEVADDAMELSGKGLLPGSILSCSIVEDYQQATLEEVYVLITETAVYVRRLVQNQKKLSFRPDNPAYEWQTFMSQDVLELWKVEGFYSTVLSPPSLHDERLAQLEKRINDIERIMRM